MPAALETPAAVQATPLSPADRKEPLPNVSQAWRSQLPVEVVQPVVQPVLSPFDRLVRDFPDLFILVSLC
jgi:hypothetical protein